MKILKNSKIRLALLLSCFVFLDAQSCFAQSTTNQSTVSNSAAPSASSVTTGGTNVNTQVNNAYANDLSFGVELPADPKDFYDRKCRQGRCLSN